MSVSIVTGASGQIGSYLLEQLTRSCKAIGLCRNISSSISVPNGAELHSCDICSYCDIYSQINHYRPERIFHLATYHFRSGPWHSPQDVVNTNIIGTVNVLEAIRAVRSEDASYDPVVVITGTAMCYGESLQEADTPITEDIPLLPQTPYALSKTAQEILAEQYFKTHEIKTVRTRLFAVTSPKADHGSVFDFTRKVASIEKGIIPDELEVGNLNVFRSITHASDVAAALILLSESTAYGDVFNICMESYYSISDVLKRTAGKSLVPLTVTVREDKFPASERFLVGNPSKLLRIVAWQPKYSLDMIIDEMLAYFRENGEYT